ncbi:uncharacterized protein LOC21405365 [Morus notabilis]|nr:uncharacterized protein LOC21405365 [Morus notabilis]
MFGIHQVFNHEVEDFSNKLAQSSNDHLYLEMNFNRHCQKLLEGANELVDSDKITVIKNGEGSSGVPQNEAEHDDTAWDDIDSIEYKNFINETYSLLSAVFQGSFARHNCFYLLLPFPILSPWFFHHSVGNVAVCYLPPNIYEDERWLGLELYVKCELRRSRTVGDSTSEIVDLNIDLYAHGKSMSPILCHKIKIPVHSRFVTIHVPRKYFSEELNNYEGLSVIFMPTTPDVEVKMCGTRLLYEQESKMISKGIIQCIFQIPSLLQVVHEAAIGLLQSDQSDNDESNIALQREMPQSSRMPTYEPRERNIIKSLQKFLTSTEQLAKEVSTSIGKHGREYAEKRVFVNADSVLLHSKQSFLKNWENKQEDTPCELSGTFNHLHIIAESILSVSDSQNQIETLKVLLREFFKHRVLVTLSLKGHIVFALKNFVPGSPYNLCFPQKGIPKWFDDHQLNNSMVAIALPPNLSHDESWKGLVICASFSVNENPDAFSKGSFRLLCHLASEGICMNPVALCSVTKDKIKWLYVRGFIWLAYIPNVMLADELNGKHIVEAKIYSYCPGLIVDKCGIRLLYENDVEELKQTIIQCCTSFVKDWDIMDKLVANEDDEASFSTDRLDAESRMFGMHQVFNHEVKDFSDKLSQNANDHLDLEMNFDRHCQKLLEVAASGNITAVKLEGGSSSGVTQNEAEQDHTVWDAIPSTEYKNFINETYSLLSVVFQGRFARHNCFHLVFPFAALLPLFFHHSVGNVTVCYLPSNIYKDERWLGLELYAECEPRRSDSVGDLASSKGVDLEIDLYAHGKSMLPIFTHRINIPISGFVAIHVPRKYFPEDLNNFKGISAIFKPSTPDVVVKMCGTRLLYEHESKLISRRIMESIFQMPMVLRFVHGVVNGLLQNYQSDDDESDIAFKREMPQTRTTYEPREWNFMKSLQKLLTSAEQFAREVSTSIDEYRREYVERRAFNDTDPVLVHSKHSFFKNRENIQEDTLGESFGTFNQANTVSQLAGIFNHLAEATFNQKDTLSGLPSTFNCLHIMAEITCNHLHIMAESILHVSDSQNLIETLKILLREFFKHRVLVTLSLKGHIVFALKHFVPSSPYNLCFPQKGIPKWFDDHQLNNSMVAIALPPNLSHDKSWKGLVICASFSVNENPDAFSKGSFRVLCHLASEGICLNPVALCSVTKDKIKWLYVRGFIWLAYIPNVMLAELNGKNSVEARIYSQYPGLIVDKCGIRLLYEKDVEQLKQTIIQCCTSFVEDWDLMDKFVANEDYE